ncbi:MAG: EamA family transporter, partial [bacterium]
TAPFALAQGLPTGGQWWLVLGIGLGATGGQFGMTMAYRLGEATRVGPLSYATVVFSAAAGVLVFGESLSAWTVGGVALIIAAGAALSAGVGRRSPGVPRNS